MTTALFLLRCVEIGISIRDLDLLTIGMVLDIWTEKGNDGVKYDRIADEILRLRDMRKQAEVDSVVKDEQMRLIQDLQDFIHQQPTTITEFDETLVKRLITKITVFEDHFTIDFKSGVTIEIKA